jgi:hypothetical protein
VRRPRQQEHPENSADADPNGTKRTHDSSGPERSPANCQSARADLSREGIMLSGASLRGRADSLRCRARCQPDGMSDVSGAVLIGLLRP